MIYYDTRDVLAILTSFSGSPMLTAAPLQAMTMAVFALILATINFYVPNAFVDLQTSVALAKFNLIANTFIGFMMSFRLNSAFQQWKSGLRDITLFTQSARSVVSLFASCLTRSDDPQELLTKKELLTDMRRLILVYTTVVFHDCREIDSLPKLQASGWLTTGELQELNACGAIFTTRQSKRFSSSSAASNRARAALVELWIRRIVQDGLCKGFLNPPQLATINNIITQLPTLHGRVYNQSNIPIPFSYCQYVLTCIYMYLVLFTLVIVPTSGFYSPIWVFLWGMVLLVAEYVASEIECPFGTDPNDIDLEERKKQFEDELTSLTQGQMHYWGIFTSDDVAALTPAPLVKKPVAGPEVTLQPAALQPATGVKPRKLKTNKAADETSALLPTPTMATQSSTSSNESYGISV
ncbi:hypothetical protein THRCLA_02300 [Thraustotheca clavata]|uniref:Uncharacterized protein n=1 Tax=Thraustotheca clavata TaxID=74557 RepID=A0A1W0A5S0_9STRA|nr:hypothetical protein THRCLA_02300 [Thraustotheca clavata]